MMNANLPASLKTSWIEPSHTSWVNGNSNDAALKIGADVPSARVQNQRCIDPKQRSQRGKVAGVGCLALCPCCLREHRLHPAPHGAILLHGTDTSYGYWTIGRGGGFVSG